MKKIAMIAASLAVLATPVLAQSILDGLEGRNVLIQAQGPERL
jgi:hypothetical protein